MRKNALAMSVATLIGGLGFVGAASADVIVNGTGGNTPTSTQIGTTSAVQLVVAAGGIGHSLIVPYFTAQNGNATVISLTNTDVVNGKAVKIRFRSAPNSDDILDFYALLSPGDVWNGVVSGSSTSPAHFFTADKSCTLPPFPTEGTGGGTDFQTGRLTGKDAVNGLNASTREGYVEIFNAADIPPLTGATLGTNSALYNTIKHKSGIPTCDQAGVIEPALQFNHLTEDTAAAKGMASPTTGLYGGWTIINVPETTTFSGEMNAIRAVDGLGADARGNFVQFPQRDAAYTGPNIDFVTADPLLRTVAFTAKNQDASVVTATTTGSARVPVFFDMPDMSTPYTLTAALSTTSPLDQAGKLTAALAVRSFANDYATDAIVAAKTQWIQTMPTRRYSVVMDYAPTTSRILFSPVTDPAAVAPVIPNAQFFWNGNTTINTNNAQQICVSATAQTFYDREETTQVAGTTAVFSPGNGVVNNKAQFCGESSSLVFANSGPAVLGSSVTRQDIASSAIFTNGWGVVNVTDATTFLGLPIIGGAFIKLTNPSVSTGLSGTYGISFNHRSVK